MIRVTIPIILSLILVSCESTTSFESDGTSGMKVYGTSGDEDVSTVITARDGGSLAVGAIAAVGVSTTNYFVMKLSATGEQQWTRQFGGTGNDRARDALALEDGGFLVVGQSESFSVGLSDVWVIRLDASGDSIWSRSYGTTGDEAAHCVMQTSTGQIVIGGLSRLGRGGAADILLMSIDAEGNEIWKSTTGGLGEEIAQDLVESPEGDIIVLATAATQVAIDRFSPDGTPVPGMVHPTSVIFNANATSILLTGSGEYVVAGYSRKTIPANGVDSLFVAKLGSTLFTRVWEVHVGKAGGNRAAALTELSDGSYGVAGYTRAFDGGRSDYYLTRIDDAGTVVSERTVGGNGIDEARAIFERPTGEIVVFGNSNSFAGGRNQRDLSMLITRL